MRRLLPLLVAALLVAVAGCGLTENDAPQVIASENLPPDLLDPNPGSSTSVAGTGETEPAPVFLIERDGDTTRLRAVDREVIDADEPGQRLVVLLMPPSEDELADGLITSIPTDTVLLDTDLDEEARELVVDLSDEIFAIQSSELANAFAQIVYTATEVEGVSQVRFLVEGEEIQTLDGEGRPVDGAVTRADYVALNPR
jgi:spore germination protein GerM